MKLGILTLITALCISAVAIYYSVAGLVAIFAAAAVPIMIMGGVLEIGKLVTAVWLHKYWKQATWWLKSYLSVAVIVLMFITSMGIFGFLSKAHIEQTSASEESIARVETIQNEIDRQLGIVGRAENRIRVLESSETGADANIQTQIDKEQERIDKAFDRIQPAITQQNKIIEDARTNDSTRTKPYEDQLTSITAEILRLETSAKEYEAKIENLDTDNSGVEPLLAQIDAIEKEIIRVTNQLQSSERDQIRAGQAIIGVTSDGAFGGNTRRALVAWVAAQRERITQIQGEVATVRKNATTTVDNERVRLADVVKDIRTVQIPALKERELTMLGKIDEVRQTESPVIATARDEIQRLRKSAEVQVAQSNELINRLRAQLGNKENADEVQKAIDEQNERVRTASSEIETLTEERIALESEYRKLEAEVGPIKYIAEFVYGEQADNNMLEEAVRWVIMIIIFVFDPLAVLLLIASQYTFEFRKPKDDDGERLRLEREEYERARAQRIIDNPGFTLDDPVPPGVEEPTDSVPVEEKEEVDDEFDRSNDEQSDRTAKDGTESDTGSDTRSDTKNDSGSESSEPQVNNGEHAAGTDDIGGDDANRMEPVLGDLGDIPDTKNRMFYPEELDPVDLSNDKQREAEYKAKEQDINFQTAKESWKNENPDLTIKHFKELFTKGLIDSLPWEKNAGLDNYNVQEGYQQNAEQGESTLFNKLSNK